MAGPSNRKHAPSLRPKYQWWSLYDRMTGRFVKGLGGLWYSTGGLGHMIGFTGRANTYKSTAAGCCMATASLRYKFEYTEVYDTELTLKRSRIGDYVRSACYNNPHLGNVDVETLFDSETNPWCHTSSDRQLGDEWWADNYRGELDNRRKIPESKRRTTVFTDFNGKLITVQNPWVSSVDSVSELQVTSVDEIYDDNMAGESGLNMVAVRDAGAKAQLLKQMPLAGARANYNFILIAHADDALKLDPYAPNEKKLAGLKGNLKLKGIPGRAMSFLPQSILMATSIGPLLDSEKKSLYPHPNQIASKNAQVELNIVRFEELRGKDAPTGAFIDMIFSQTEGFLEGLSEFHYLKEICMGWGMEVENKQKFTLDLYPHVSFTRKTIRKLIEDDPKFARALSITAGCAYEQHNWFNMLPQYKISMRELYTKIKERGFDWDEILGDTVDYWYFKDQTEEIGMPTVTTWTLYDMAAGVLDGGFLNSRKKGKKGKTTVTKEDVPEIVVQPMHRHIPSLPIMVPLSQLLMKNGSSILKSVAF